MRSKTATTGRYIRSPLTTRRLVFRSSWRAICRRPFVSITAQRSLKIPMRPIGEQRIIGAVLSAFDELAANNSRRIKICEELAQRTFREWFVDFRYPGHEASSLIDSPYGRIPQGWAVETVDACTTVLTRGVSPKYDDAAAGVVINQRCIRNGRLSLAASRRHKTKVPEEKLVREGDVLINSTGVGTLGRVAQALVPLERTTVDSHVTLVRLNVDKVTSTYFGLALLSRQSEFESMGGGSTGQTELGRSRIAEARIVVPPKPLQEAFEELLKPFRSIAPVLEAENRCLAGARDVLLPRLVSGEIDVDDLEGLPEAA
jgi:type I restriction enzyme S subunit